MDNSNKHFESYVTIRQHLINKQNESLRRAIQNKIKYYRGLTADYKVEVDKHITSTFNYKQSKSFLAKEESNYSTRLNEKLDTTLPLYDILISDLEKPFKLFVMGPGNYGKSTVINSLLGTGKKHAPENVRPLTWKIDIFEKNQKENQVTLVYKNGKTEKLTVVQASEKIQKEERLLEQSKKEINTKLKQIVKENKLGFTEISELKLKMEREDVYHSPLVETHWGVKDSTLLESFSIVDTPGLDQVNFSGDVKKNAIDYYHKSDGVLWILDAHTINAKNSDKMLRELEDTLKNIGGTRAASNMIAVLNRIDLVSQNPKQREEVIAEANKLFKGMFKSIVPYSALQAYKAIEENDSILMESSGINDLKNEIQRVFYKNASRIQSFKKNEACEIYTSQINQSVSDFQDQLSTDKKKLEDGIEASSSRLKEKVYKSRSNFFSALDNHLKNFDYSIESHLDVATKCDSDDDRRKYLETEVYKTEYLNKLLKDYSVRAKDDYSYLANQLIREFTFTQYKELDKFREGSIHLPNVKHITIPNIPDIFMPNVGKSTAIAGGVGMLFGPIGGIIGAGAGLYLSREARSKSINESKRVAKDMVQKYKNAFTSFIVSYYDEGSDELCDSILQSFCSVYSIEIKDSSSIIDSAETLMNKNEYTIEKINDTKIKFIPDAKTLLLS